MMAPLFRTKFRRSEDQNRRTRFLPALERLEERQLLTLDPLLQPRFVNPLPIPAIMQPEEPGGTHYEVSISQFQQELGVFHPVTGEPFQTTVWGYNGSSPGPTFEVRRGTPITVRWTNDLIDGTGVLPHLFEVNTKFHWANPKGWPESGVPVVTHVHGGHTESASDGLPEAWFTPRFDQMGMQWVHETYYYDNAEDARTLWYHDHTLGITRLNVYAGLAGLYFIRDNWEDGLNLPRGQFEIPLVIQDRVLSDDGQLQYDDPVGRRDGFFGDFIMVNGKAWPFAEVEPRKYRLRLLNASDSRFYELAFVREKGGAHDFMQIGSEGGLLERPVVRNRLLLAPGERTDVVVDFSQLKGQSLRIRNTAPAPFPSGGTPDPATVGQVMQFRVTRPLSEPDTSEVPRTLRKYPQLEAAVRTRRLIMSMDWGAHGTMHTLGTVADGRLRWMDPVTENPQLGDVEIWEFYNNTPLSHPIHIHLATFRVLNVQDFTAEEDPTSGALRNIEFVGDPMRSDLDRRGIKDTVVVNFGQVVRVIAKFDREGDYTWHCHMLTHEDHEMMRPFTVGSSGAPGYCRGCSSPHCHGCAADGPDTAADAAGIGASPSLALGLRGPSGLGLGATSEPERQRGIELPELHWALVDPAAELAWPTLLLIRDGNQAPSRSLLIDLLFTGDWNTWAN
jgi:spore coat protein A